MWNLEICGEPYAGKLHVRFDEGAGVPHGASRSTLHPIVPTSVLLERISGNSIMALKVNELYA